MYLNTGDPSNYAVKYWWPRQNVWLQSGLGVNYWSLECEKVFGMHLNEIREGVAPLRTQKEWKKFLKRFAPLTKPIIKGRWLVTPSSLLVLFLLWPVQLIFPWNLQGMKNVLRCS